MQLEHKIELLYKKCYLHVSIITFLVSFIFKVKSVFNFDLINVQSLNLNSISL